MGGNHYSGYTFPAIQAIDKGTKMAADDYQIGLWPVQANEVGKNFFPTKRDQVKGKIHFLTQSLDLVHIQATV